MWVRNDPVHSGELAYTPRYISWCQQSDVVLLTGLGKDQQAVNDMGTGMDAGRQMPSAEPESFQHDSRIGELFVLWFKNFVLRILTFGIYGFWGKTEIRRLLWQRTSLMDDAFEYHGLGKELFLGAVIVFVVVAIPSMVMQLIAELSGSEAASIIATLGYYLVLLGLLPLGIFRARRYILTRTSWRGVRADLPAGQKQYWLNFLLMFVLDILTLRLSSPWTRARLAEILWRNTSFGDAMIECGINARKLYLPWIVSTLIFVCVAGALAGSGMLIIEDACGTLDYDMCIEAQPQIVWSMFGLFLVGIFLMPICYSWYEVTFLRQLYGNMALDGMRMVFPAGFSDMVKLQIRILLLSVFLPGFGWLLAMRSRVGFLFDHIELHNAQVLEELVSRKVSAMTTGEGLAEALYDGVDVGF